MTPLPDAAAAALRAAGPADARRFRSLSFRRARISLRCLQ